jgi:hypothetical protein
MTPQEFDRQDAQELAQGAGVELGAVLRYLDQLRASGQVNMFGAGPYLEEVFGLSALDAWALLAYWMKTFDARGRPGREGGGRDTTG